MSKIEYNDTLINQDKIMHNMESNPLYIIRLINFTNDAFKKNNLYLVTDNSNDVANSKVTCKLIKETTDKLYYFYEVVKRYAKEYYLRSFGNEYHDYYLVKFTDENNIDNYFNIGVVNLSDMNVGKNFYYCKKVKNPIIKNIDRSSEMLDFNKVLRKNKYK